MITYKYYMMECDEDFMFEVIIAPEPFLVMRDNPHYPDKIFKLIWCRESHEFLGDRGWTKADDNEFIEIDDNSVVKEMDLGFYETEMFPPGFFQL